MAAKGARTAKATPAVAEVPIDYRTIDRVTGPLLFVREIDNAAYGEIVEITLPSGERRQGQVLDSRKGLAIVGPKTWTIASPLRESSTWPWRRSPLGRVISTISP